MLSCFSKRRNTNVEHMHWEPFLFEDSFDNPDVPLSQTPYLFTNAHENSTGFPASARKGFTPTTAVIGGGVVLTNGNKPQSPFQLPEGANSPRSGPVRMQRPQLGSPATPWSKQKTKCSFCGLHLLKKTLQRHLRTKHNSLKSTIECFICEARFTRSDILSRHINEQHGECSGEAGTVECMYCHGMIRERALKDHLRSRSCLAVKKGAKQSDRLPSSDTCTDEHNCLAPSWSGLEFVIDAETAFCFAKAALLSVSRQIFGETYETGVINLASGSELHLYEFQAFRRLAMRSLQRELVVPSAQTHVLALLLVILEVEAFEKILNFSGKHLLAARRANAWSTDASTALDENVREACQRLADYRMSSPSCAAIENNRRWVVKESECLIWEPGEVGDLVVSYADNVLYISRTCREKVCADLAMPGFRSAQEERRLTDIST